MNDDFNKQNVICFDFGTKNIGIAIGQCITCTAQPITELKSFNEIPDWKKIKKIFIEWNPSIAIVGLPLNMDGTEYLLTYKAKIFANQIFKLFKIKVFLHDERLTTVEARSLLFSLGGYKFIKKIHSTSAIIILESWLRKNKK